MIARALDIFVERIAIESVGPRLVTARRLLMIDACARPLSGGAMLTNLAARSPVSPELIRFDQLGRSPERPAIDLAWILLDAGSDLVFCELLRDELAREAPSGAHLVGVGELEVESLAGRLEARHFGAGRPWRRGRDLAEGADAAARLLAQIEAAS